MCNKCWVRDGKMPASEATSTGAGGKGGRTKETARKLSTGGKRWAWSAELIRQFVTAVDKLGGVDKASPTRIVELMVGGCTG
jgi:SHAQKYF class myb-like DNA-binding protein